MLPQWMVRIGRSGALQPFYERMQRWAQVGMNHWGGSDLRISGERTVLQRLARELRSVERAVIFDVGANEGEFTRAVLDAFGRRAVVHAFEPQPTSEAAFLSNHKARVADGTIGLHRIGLSDAPGTAILHAPTPGSSIASLYAGTLEATGRRFEDQAIELRTLDDVCRELGIERIHYLKIDTEGHELAVLQGARGMISSGRIDRIQFEFGECHLDSRVFFRDIHRFLGDGYRIHRILPGGTRVLGPYTPELEVYRTANYLAVATSLKGAQRP